MIKTILILTIPNDEQNATHLVHKALLMLIKTNSSNNKNQSYQKSDMADSQALFTQLLAHINISINNIQ